MKNIKTIALDIGHNTKEDIGAVGIKREDTLNLQVGNHVIERLRGLGINVINCTPKTSTSLTNSLQSRCDAANRSGAEIFISIHHNASPGGHGCEGYCIFGGIAEKTGREILNEISSLGFRNRGMKNGGGLYVVRNTIMPALLIECAFVDSISDMEGYDPIKVGDCIFNGLVRALSLQNDCYYVVLPGDTLWGISRKFNTTIEALVSLNGIKDKNLIRVSDRLRVR
ncbi:MAG: N-acetylmuramoyl-L-alanine amidase [Clostridium sp.]